MKISIIGGGVAELSLLLGILNHSDPRVIQPHLYEAAHSFGEIGAGVGFLPQAVRAMRAIEPKLHEAYSCIADEAPDDGLTVTFEDDTTEVADAAISCDGVKSQARKILHGEKYEPQYTGKYAYRGASEWAHGSSWVVPSTVQDVLHDFGDFSERVKKLLSLLQNPDKRGFFEIPLLKTYVTGGRICLMGDCAHASTPHLGAGAGMAIEDAAVLSRVIGEIQLPDPALFSKAFAAYDAVRRESTQKLITTSRNSGLLYDFERPGIVDYISKIPQALPAQWDWIWDLDIDAHCREAVEIMHQPYPANDF